MDFKLITRLVTVQLNSTIVTTITGLVTVQYSTVLSELIQNKKVHMPTVFHVNPIATIVSIKEVMASLHGIELSLSLNTNSSALGSINLCSTWAAILQNLQVKLKLKIPKPT